MVGAFEGLAFLSEQFTEEEVQKGYPAQPLSL